MFPSQSCKIAASDGKAFAASAALDLGAQIAHSNVMKRLLVVSTILTAILVAAAPAADISGNWKGTADFQGQAIERTFVFKVDGTKLTGETTSELLGKSTIEDGKIDGDNISFTITANLQGNDLKMNYKGKVVGDTIKLSVDLGAEIGGTIEWTLKKA
jgi:opacity protein-like surface antigen